MKGTVINVEQPFAILMNDFREAGELRLLTDFFTPQRCGFGRDMSYIVDATTNRAASLITFFLIVFSSCNFRLSTHRRRRADVINGTSLFNRQYNSQV